ncbi:MAG TPA: penicillin-binding protein, partial [Pseudolabrys sp.]|nr:penicillin-binding protein [Pseudolabrys sp.]
GVAAAGKTGTTNAYRDAWFMGYTGNFVCGVWFGNDNYEPLNRMTGGSLPAMTWHSIMAYAHEGIELKQLPGVPVPQVRQQSVVAENAAKTKSAVAPPPPRPALLTRKGADVLVRIERTMDDANKQLGPTTSNQPPPSPVAPARPVGGKQAEATSGSGAAATRN